MGDHGLGKHNLKDHTSSKVDPCLLRGLDQIWTKQSATVYYFHHRASFIVLLNWYVLRLRVMFKM